MAKRSIKETFDHAMAALGPFETAPRLAVAVSGGADSLALCLLADRWARARHGSVQALTVDHGLRPESGEEACQVGTWLTRYGISQTVLRWYHHKEKPIRRVQEQARLARLEMMEVWCRENGVLHLLLGHHALDQAETVVMRRARDPNQRLGLAGISAVVERSGVRLLRPLLTATRADHEVFLSSQDQPWISDPSNEDRRYERVRVRHALTQGEEAINAVLSLAAQKAKARIALEHGAAQASAHSLTFDPLGYATLSQSSFEAAHRRDRSAVRLALARAIQAIGGRAYAPASPKLEVLCEKLARGEAGMTLGRVRFVERRDAPGSLLICRENRHLPPPMMLTPGAQVVWDGRFRIERPMGVDQGAWTLMPHGDVRPDGPRCVPQEVARTLPCVTKDGQILFGLAPEVTPNVYREIDGNTLRISWRPPNTVSALGFFQALW